MPQVLIVRASSSCLAEAPTKDCLTRPRRGWPWCRWRHRPSFILGRLVGGMDVGARIDVSMSFMSLQSRDSEKHDTHRSRRRYREGPSSMPRDEKSPRSARNPIVDAVLPARRSWGEHAFGCSGLAELIPGQTLLCRSLEKTVPRGCSRSSNRQATRKTATCVAVTFCQSRPQG